MTELIKLCVFCTHCKFEEAISYSEYTYQSESWHCAKGHWSYLELDRIRGKDGFEYAMKCKDFDMTDEIKELL